jgi:hypothetical protein
MTNSELAELLNSTAGLEGNDGVTANVIREWVGWDLLPRAEARGRARGLNPDWSRSNSALRRATRLAELRKAAVRRENALVVQAYLEWGFPDFVKVRSALLSEFRKCRNQLIRRKITFFEGRQFGTISAAQLRAFSNQNGPLAERFVETQFEQSKEAYAVLAEAMSRSETELPDLVRIIQIGFDRLDREAGATIPTQCLTAFANSFPGLTGFESEIDNSGETIIQTASERKYREARYRMRKLRTVIQRAGIISPDVSSGSELLRELSLLGPQITIGPWSVMAFVQALKLSVPI